MEYYIYKGTDPEGPYSIEQLEQLAIGRKTLVWHEGLEEPILAQDIEQLRPLISKIPPKLNGIETGAKPTTPPVLSRKENEQKEKSNGDKSKSAKKLVYGVLTLGLIIGVALVVNTIMNDNGNLFYRSSSTSASQARTKPMFENAVHDAIEDRAERERKAKYRNNLGSYLNPHPNNYKKDLVFGGIWDAEVKMDNKTPYTLDQVVVEVGYYKADGGLYKTEQVVFKNMGAGERQAVHAPNSDKGVEIRCWVTSAYSSELY